MISVDQLQVFDTQVCKESQYRHQRYGQAFCNYFGIQDTDIFYTDDYRQVINMIYTRYIDA